MADGPALAFSVAATLWFFSLAWGHWAVGCTWSDAAKGATVSLLTAPFLALGLVAVVAAPIAIAVLLFLLLTAL